MRTFRSIVFFSLVMIVLAIVLQLFPFARRITQTLTQGAAYVAHVGYRGRVELLGGAATSTPALNNELLRTRNIELQKENDTLRNFLEFKKRTQDPLILAEVISRSLDPQRALVFINKGKNEGIALHAPVIFGNGVLVGTVSSLTDTTATVRLLSDPQSHVIGRLLNETLTEGIVTGGHGIVVRMELVPRSERVETGQALMSSGLDSHIPRGLLIGNVISTMEDVHTLFQRVIIEPPIEYERLVHVAIIKQPSQ